MKGKDEGAFARPKTQGTYELKVEAELKYAVQNLLLLFNRLTLYLKICSTMSKNVTHFNLEAKQLWQMQIQPLQHKQLP